MVIPINGDTLISDYIWNTLKHLKVGEFYRITILTNDLWRDLTYKFPKKNPDVYFRVHKTLKTRRFVEHFSTRTKQNGVYNKYITKIKETDMEETELKRKIKVRKDHTTVNHWVLVSASGFFPDKQSWTDEELKDYLARNDDINPTLVF